MKKNYFRFIVMMFFTASISSYAQVGGYLDCNPASSVVATSGTVTELDGASAFTFEAKVRFTSFANLSNIISKLPAGDINNRIGIQVTSTGVVTCIVANGGNASKSTSTAVLQLNTWYHIAMVYNGALTTAANRIALYINGVAHTSFTNSGTLPATTPSTGAFTTTPLKVDGGNFVGDIDEVRVWNTALTQPAIDAWKGTDLNNTHPNYANLKLYWNFNDTATPTVAKDIDEKLVGENTYDGAITNALYVNTTLSTNDFAGIMGQENTPVFPNPFNSELSVTLNLSENADVSLSLYDLGGKLVKQTGKKNDSAGIQIYTIKTESLPKGFYLLKVSTNGKAQTFKVVKD